MDDAGRIMDTNGSPIIFSAGVKDDSRTHDRFNFTHQLKSLRLYNQAILSGDIDKAEELEAHFDRVEDDTSIPAAIQRLEEEAEGL